jgi:hypothetical protein
MFKKSDNRYKSAALVFARQFVITYLDHFTPTPQFLNEMIAKNCFPIEVQVALDFLAEETGKEPKEILFESVEFVL